MSPHRMLQHLVQQAVHLSIWVAAQHLHVLFVTVKTIVGTD